MALTYQGVELQAFPSTSPTSGLTISFHSSTGDLTTDTGELIMGIMGGATYGVTSYSGSWNIVQSAASSFGWDSRWRISTGSSETAETVSWTTQGATVGYVAVSGIVSESNPFRGTPAHNTYYTAGITIPTDAEWSCPSISGGVTGDLLVCMWVTDRYTTDPGTWTVPGGMTSRASTDGINECAMLIATKELGSDGATGAQTASFSGTAGARAHCVSFLVASTEPPAPTSTSAFKAGARF